MNNAESCESNLRGIHSLKKAEKINNIESRRKLFPDFSHGKNYIKFIF